MNVLQLSSVEISHVPALTLSVQFNNQKEKIQYAALLDRGASSNFISGSLALECGIPLSDLKEPLEVHLADGSVQKIYKKAMNVKFIIKESSSGPLDFKADLMVIDNL